MFPTAIHKNDPRVHHRSRDLWLQWTVAVALGELIGFGVPAVALPFLIVAGMSENILPLAAFCLGRSKARR